MKPISWLGVLLIVAGVVLASGRFSYTSDRDTVSMGPVEVVATRKSTVPTWVGVLLMVGGGALIVAGARRK